MKKFSISKSDVKLAFSEKSIFHQNLCSLCLNMTPLTILDPSRGPWTGSWLATGDRNSKFPEIFVVSLYLRDLLVFDVISLVNIYNSEKRNFEKKGKISVDFSSVWWMKKFFRVWHHHVTWSHPLSWRCRDASLVGRDIVIPHQHHTGKWRNTNHRLIYIENWKIQSKKFW